MSLLGTSAAFLTALGVAAYATRGIPETIYRPRCRLFHGAQYVLARAALAVMRATPVVVLGIICVAAIGLGPKAGIIGIWFHTTGVLAKYMSESYEASDREVLDAAAIDGCDRMRAYFSVLVPMNANALIAYLLYYYEANFRQATFLGVVGAGGIGLHLTTSVGLFDYRRTGTIVLMIIGTALAFDMASRLIRRRFL